MASWIKSADRVVMIDGCFLQCHGRALKGLVPLQKIVELDSHPMPREYAKLFSMDDVPEQEREAVARQVAALIVAHLRQVGVAAAE